MSPCWVHQTHRLQAPRRWQLSATGRLSRPGWGQPQGHTTACGPSPPSPHADAPPVLFQAKPHAQRGPTDSNFNRRGDMTSLSPPSAAGPAPRLPATWRSRLKRQRQRGAGRPPGLMSSSSVGGLRLCSGPGRVAVTSDAWSRGCWAWPRGPGGSAGCLPVGPSLILVHTSFLGSLADIHALSWLCRA